MDGYYGYKALTLNSSHTKGLAEELHELFQKKETNTSRGPRATKRNAIIATMWSIWLHRNEVIFKRAKPNRLTVMNIFQDSVCRATNLQATTNLRIKGSDEKLMHPIITNESTEFLKAGINTLNYFPIISVDGSWKQLKKESRIVAAIAWINELDTRCYSSRKIFAISPIQAEAYAVLIAIEENSFQDNLLIQTDSIEVITALHNPAKGDKNIRTIINKIVILARKFVSFKCVKVGRNVIHKAHSLASRARKERF